ncbi:MAG: hypothetical protein GY880_03840 [Planctomycetaceae bacterium]|nr:hypothetical protein [Planctomycetaceae bacterium]
MRIHNFLAVFRPPQGTRSQRNAKLLTLTSVSACEVNACLHGDRRRWKTCFVFVERLLAEMRES